MRPLGTALFALLALLAAACGNDDDTATPTTVDQTTSTSATASSTTTSTEPDDERWERCTNGDGFAISYPPDWTTNDGSVVGACSQFDPEPFEVPEASDRRVAAITAFVEDVPFFEAAGPGQDVDHRWITAVDEHQAVRLEGPSGELYPDDADVVRYLIDLSTGIDDGPGTLIVDTVELSNSDYERNVRILDRMARTIELDATDQYPDSTVVGRYEGGGNTFSATAAVDGDDICVRAPADGEPTTACLAAPPADGLRIADFSGDLFTAAGGVTGSDAFRVEISQPESTSTFLPVPIEGTDARGFVLPVGIESATVTWFDIDGEQLGSLTLDGESDVEQ